MSEFRSAKASWVPLVEYRRGTVTEVVIHGAITWVSGSKVIHELGGQDLIFGRSLTKPFQMKGLARDLDRELSLDAKALSVASHGSEDIHLQTLKTILKKEELKLIVTPPSMPLSPHSGAKALSPFYHPCSGKHAAILLACELKGWPTYGYTSSEHPYHQVYLAELRKVLGADWRPEAMEPDGCTLPTFSTTVKELAQLYSSLVKTKNDDWIWQAMTSRPEIVGGTGRLDTAIMKMAKGRVLAKEGADGLLGLAIDHPDYKDGLGVVIKIAHGWDPKATASLACKVLEKLGFELEPPSNPDGQSISVNPQSWSF